MTEFNRIIKYVKTITFQKGVFWQNNGLIGAVSLQFLNFVDPCFPLLFSRNFKYFPGEINKKKKNHKITPDSPLIHQ